jgi:hypothetical protein
VLRKIYTQLKFNQMITRLFYLGLFIGMMVPGFLSAQISGTKTIGGTNPDYATFSAAASALNSSGINGTVVFNVAPGTYTEQFTLNNITGSSSANTITFQSSTGDSTDVILKYASSSSSTNNFVVKLNGTDYTTFKSMTIERSGSSTYATVISVTGTSDYISFKNNVIKNGSLNSTSNFTSLIYATNGTGNVHSNYTYSQNRFINGGVAIYNFGADANNLSSGNTVEKNVFINQGKYAIAFWYQNAPQVIANIINSNSTNSAYCAFNGNYVKNAFVFKNNKITLAKGTGLFLQASVANSNTGLITNNFIAIAGTSSKGLSYNNSGYHNIYFNSIRMGGANSVGFYLSGSSSTANRFKNNIVQVGSSSMCMEITNTNNPFNAMDYNDYYFPGGNMGKFKTSTVHSSLSAWRTATGKEANSMNANPLFLSSTDLHINTASTIALQGTSANNSPFSVLDIDGDLRNTSTPDIGADEFTVSDLAADSIHINTQMCDGENYNITIDIKNMGTSPISIIVPVGYQLGAGSSIQLGLANISNLAAGATFAYTPSVKIPGNPLGTHPIKVWVKMQNDTDPANDTASVSILVSPYPVSKLPNDTSICANKSVTLDPGAGFDTYLWYDGTQTQTYTLDSTGIGLGGKYIAVTITDNGCSTMDSTLVLFHLCTGIENADINNQLRVYPNPASDFISIDNQSNETIQGIEILSIDGQLVAKLQEDNLSRINTSELSPGVYYLRIETEKGIAIKKIIIK